jgi:hypothetical protein
VTVLDHLAAYRVTRPARALVLVPLPDGVPWQAPMMAALRGQAATWGGSANLVVPWADDLLERQELWRIATALDPDVIAVTRLAGSDFAGIVGEGDPLLGAGDDLGRPERPKLEALLQEFGERLPILQRNGQARPLFSDAAGIRFPCTPVAAVGGDLGPAPALRCSVDLDLGLMLAAEAGDLANTVIATLARRGIVVTPHDLSRDDARDRALRGPDQPGADGAWALSEAGLRWLLAITQSPLTVSVVVGDEPWDFALGYALRRTTGLAWWLSKSVLADPWTVQWLLQRIEQIGEFAERGTVASLSDRAAAESLAEELGTVTSDGREWSVAEDALELLRARPARLFSRAPGLETFALQDGATGFLPPELPEVGEAPGQRIYWMAELLGDNWQPLPDARLATEVVRWPSYDSASARPTRSGVAYLCPHYLRMSDDMASEVVRPRIGVLGLREQLATILAESGWRLEPSDKGQYAEGAAKLFGGDEELRAALSTPSWWGTLKALRSEVAPDEGRRGWKLADQRTYYELAELDAIRAETGLGADVSELLRRRILMRGLVFRCPLCRLKAWYGADELADRLRCARCREPFGLTGHGWQPEAEPQWRYRLNELLWQLLVHNGDVPLRALRETLGIGTLEVRQPTASLHEHDLWKPGAKTPSELDICAQRGPELWIGEAKVGNSLGQEQEARSKLEGLRQAAQLLRPQGILFVTASEGWTDRTQELAREVLGELPSELRFERCARPL